MTSVFRWLIPFIAFVLCGACAKGYDLYVSTNGNNTTHDNWSNAYISVQAALDNARSGDIIYMAGQTFSVSNQISWTGIASTVSFQGGYAATNNAELPGMRDSKRWPTVLRATNTNRVMQVVAVTNAILEEVTLTGGALIAPSGANSKGSGLYASNCMGLIVANCIITNNSASDGSAAYGGGFYQLGGTVMLSNCTIKGNTTIGAGSGQSLGAGICIASGTCTVYGSIIAYNRGSAGSTCNGGGIWSAGLLNLRNSLINGNIVSYTGNGIYIAGGTTIVENCTIAYNFTNGIHRNGGVVMATNSIFWGNGDDLSGTISLGSSSIEDGDNLGTNGCINADPLFEYGFYLAPDSPCVNAGTNDAVVWGLDARTTRIDGQGDTNAVDMGYHYPTGFDLTYADIYVATNGLDNNSGTNSGQPFRTLTKALAMARAGTRIHLATGVYSNGMESMPLVIEDRPCLKISGASRQGTVLNGMNLQRVLSLYNNSGQLRIESLTVMGGTTNSGSPHPDTGDGAGLLVNNCGDLTLSDCAIVSNQCSDSVIAYGGGMAAQWSAIIITNCYFAANKASGSGNGWGYGGALALLSGNASVFDSDFANNAATSAGKVGYGAAVYNKGTMGLRNCLVRGNSGAYTNGGAIYTAGISLQIVGSTLAYNGIVCLVQAAGTLVATNTILWGNIDDILGTANLSYCDVEDGDSNGVNGCISADPLFEYGFYLGNGSACIDKGTNNAIYWSLDGYTTQTSGDGDTAQIDLGYHYTNGVALDYANLYVATNGLDSNSGTNWDQAFRTITKALNVAMDGAVIRVGAGLYTNALETFPLTVSGKNGLQLLGAGRNATILDAKANNRVLSFLNDNGGIVVADMTISGGKTNSINGNGSGAGLYFQNCGNVMVKDCTIASNQCIDNSGAYGAGLMAQASVVTVSNCYFNGNMADGSGNGYGYGGALAALSGVLSIIDTIIVNNRATAAGKVAYGAALYNAGIMELRNSLVCGNAGAYTNGGAIYGAGGSLQIIGSTLAYNNIVCLVRNGGTMAATNTILWGNVDDILGAVTLASCDVENGDSDGINGCISADPLFEYGFYLGAGSPCIDKGTNSAVAWGMNGRTTQTGGAGDSEQVDIGYHYTNGISLEFANLYVATNGLDSNSGTNWDQAFRTITKALSVAKDGTTIRVGSGQYTNTLETFPLVIQGRYGFQLLGAGSSETMLNAKGFCRVLTLLNNSGRVVIDGLTLTGGKTNSGAGVLADNCGEVLIANCIITNNQSSTISPQGGGIMLTRSIATVSNCVISFNSATRIPNGAASGGGIDLDTGVMLCRETILASNTVSDQGYGGGLRIGPLARGILRNSVVATNSAPSGHGIYNGGVLMCENVTVANNKGQGVLNSGGTMAVTNGIIWGNGDDVTGTVTLAYCDIEDGDNFGTNGCINVDPLFAGAATNNYTLSKYSLCRDAGTNMNWITKTTRDLAGNARTSGTRVDIGAYEFPALLTGALLTVY